MKELHIMNPVAGKGRIPAASELSGEVHVTAGVGDAYEYAKTCVSEDRDRYVIRVYGGDGTLHEVVNGVLDAGAGSRAVVIPVPTGTGNDFERITSGHSDALRCDVIEYNGTHAVNELNMGFDTDSVVNTAAFRRMPLVSGSLAYILGVGKALINKRSTELSLTVTLGSGEIETMEGRYLLCLLANGKWYGGGFMAAPTADIADGELDLILVGDVSRRTFISLVGKYRAGRHLDCERLKPADGLEDILTFRRCRAVRIEGVGRFSADGEIYDAGGVIEARVVPSAIGVSGVQYTETV